MIKYISKLIYYKLLGWKTTGFSDFSQVKKARKFSMLTLNDDVRVIIIKIADRMHNMQTIQSLV